MPSFLHFESLRQRVASHPNTPAFKLPKAGAAGQEWVDVTFTQFQADIERMARFWLDKLQHVAPRSVVGIWLRGFTYEDVVTIMAISRANFVPQLFGFELPNTRIVFELLAKYNGKAVIHHPAKTDILVDSKTTLPCYATINYTTVSNADVADLAPLPDLPEVQDEDFVFIHHSSGSVSGMPKVIPKTNKWLSVVLHKSSFAVGAGDFGTQDVFAWSESFVCSLAMCVLQLILDRAGCLVEPTRIDFDSCELAAMIRKAGVNRIAQYGGILKRHLEDARRGSPEPELLALLKNLRQATYGGMPVPTELENWAIAERIPIINSFAYTECGQALRSSFGDRRLQLLPTVSCTFKPVGPTSIDGTDYARLLELRFNPGSPELPVAALRGPDGGWNTGDLFEEVDPGKYVFRGRDDDWIKTNLAERLDTRSIEENVHATCSDIVSNCVVVGNGRPFPALFVEPRSAAAVESAEKILELKRTILKRISDFNSLRYFHERIEDLRMIRVVAPQSLPRTAVKGNIRRRAVEQDFADSIEEMYASIPEEEVYASVLGFAEGKPNSILVAA